MKSFKAWTGRRISAVMTHLLQGCGLIAALVLLFTGFNLRIIDIPGLVPVVTIIIFTVFFAHLFVDLIISRFAMSAFRRRIMDLIILPLTALLWNYHYLFIFYLFMRQTVVTGHILLRGGRYSRFYRRVTENPGVVVLLTFAALIILGAFLLMMPVSTNTHVHPDNRTTALDAAFTSASAVCVTGLAVNDIGRHFTLFGQLVILFLIQVGGLGVMTVSTAFAMLLGQKMSLRGERVMQSVVGESTSSAMFSLVKAVIGLTFLAESLGALGMYVKFRQLYGDSLTTAYFSVFHSISAFCNAGFSLFTTGFMDFKSSWIINFNTMALIIAGGIGFSVIVDCWRNVVYKFSPTRLSLHSKVVLFTTAGLIVLGFICFFATEYYGLLRGLTFKDQFLASLFQSVTPRTAGFNTVDTTKYSGATAFFTLFLMLVGASPGSTGGGIKTTTFAVMLLSVWNIMLGRRDVSAFRRRFSDEVSRQTMALIALVLTGLFVLILLLMVVEGNNPNLPEDRFIRLLFEAVSAFGTVGLSMGVTASLTPAGKIIIIMLMYLGRVGPLTLIFAMSANRRRVGIKYTEENVGIG